MDGPTTRVRLRVIPGAGRTGIDGRYGEGWKLRVTAAPERGRANDAVVEVLTDALGLGRGQVAIVGGRGSRDKVAEVHGLDTAEVEARLSASSAVRTGVR